ncbi:hypothetical protein CLUG_00033 [Clavispora lusitaniae ATCC 42720]|uniref:tRNA-intron lyase n=1 Tax=Clavispora lusitaniae (strain ATCC 42720) TaxID=306902 RepID=C4XVR6_CLAL4|nr:uncharacterized protein CLUG_00033 [Clavispora lusitaniae ATCC 42720]EEQ35910.1 hypothetical protein CLUG_00033 [Clavispora lusitaniae ATCC 42720]
MIHLQVVHGTVLVFDVEIVARIRSLGIVGVLVGTLPKAPQQNVFLGLPLQLSTYEACWLVAHGHAQFVDALKYNEIIASNISIDDTEGRIGDAPIQYAVTPNSFPSLTDVDISPAVLSNSDFLAMQQVAPDFAAKFSAFCYLRNLDYYLMPGLRFGGVFVAYPGDPLKFHSHLIVKVLAPGQKIDLLELVTSGRLATAVKKAWVLMDEKPQVQKKEPLLDTQGNTRAFSIEWAGFG